MNEIWIMLYANNKGTVHCSLLGNIPHTNLVSAAEYDGLYFNSLHTGSLFMLFCRLLFVFSKLTF